MRTSQQISALQQSRNAVLDGMEALSEKAKAPATTGINVLFNMLYPLNDLFLPSTYAKTLDRANS